MPFAGSRLTATPIWMKACKAKTIANPAPASCAKGSRAAAERSNSLTVRTQNKIAMTAHKAKPNSSPATAKMKSEWASGRRYLIVPAPGPTPNSPPCAKASKDNLIWYPICFGLKNCVDAMAHVRKEKIGKQDQSGRAAADGTRAI